MNKEKPKLEKEICWFLSKYEQYPEYIYYINGVFRLEKRIFKRNIKVSSFTKSKYKSIIGYDFTFPRERYKNVLFIDHSYHSKTRSSFFFIAELKKFFFVDVLWSFRWKGIKDCFFTNQKFLEKYKYIIFWQIEPEMVSISEHNLRKVIYIPMWDAIMHQPLSYWLQYKEKNIRILSFSSKMHDFLKKNGLRSSLLRYPIYINKIKSFFKKKPNLYFWQRTDNFSFRHLKKIIDPDSYGYLYFRVDSDPMQKGYMLSEFEVEKYKVIQLSWVRCHKEYIKSLESIDIYISPRLAEGIGFSFIEAIENNKVIVSANEATMNEYVFDNTGYLFDMKKIEVLNLDGWMQKRKKQYRYYSSLIVEDIESQLKRLII